MARTGEAATGFASEISGSLSKGVLALSGDKVYVEEREEWKVWEQPSNVVQGLGKGVYGLGASVISGAKGLVVEPIKGSKRQGIGGFFKGIGKGIAGSITKPIAGAFDLISDTSEGIKQSAKSLAGD